MEGDGDMKGGTGGNWGSGEDRREDLENGGFVDGGDGDDERRTAA